MLVKVDRIDASYKGPKEFKTGTVIPDMSLRTSDLPLSVDLKGYTPHKHKFPDGEFWIVDVNLDIRERTLIMGGMNRTHNPDAPKQTIYVSGEMANKPLAVILRHENIPYTGSMRFDLGEVAFGTESENLKFIRKYGWYIK